MNIPGNPAVFPDELPLIDDSTVPDGSDLNVPLEALADRTAWLKAMLEALKSGRISIPDLSTSHSFGSIYVYGGHHNIEARRSYLHGGNNAFGGGNIWESSDDGLTWQSLQSTISDDRDIIDGCAGSDNQSAFAVRENDSVPRVYSFVTTDHSATMHRADPVGVHVTGAAAICFDPTSGLYCWVCRAADAATIRVATASDPSSTWTERSHANFDASYPATKLATNGAGRIVALQSGGGAVPSQSKVLYSDDGGVTWSTRTTIPHAFTALGFDITKFGTGFAFCAFSSSGTLSEVWTSPDGSFWTKVCSLSSAKLSSLISYGDFLVARSDNALLLSKDGGATWEELPGTSAMAGAAQGGLAMVGGRLYALNAASSFRSQILEEVTRKPVT